MLFQEINGAKADNKTSSKPERDQWAVFLMKVHQELMQTAAGNDIWQVAIPVEHEERYSGHEQHPLTVLNLINVETEITYFSSVGASPGIPDACLDA